jgi:hypothetical protein
MGNIEMIAKIDDRNITADMVAAMTPEELEVFENRLRQKAALLRLDFFKHRDPLRGGEYVFTRMVPLPIKCRYACVDPIRGSIIDIRDYMYSVMKK